MTEDQKKLLAVFEVRVRDLISLCDERKQKIEDITLALKQKEAEVVQLMQKIEVLNAKYENLLMAKVVSADNGEMKDAKMRLSKLVREVDKCIALLNE
jgi:hypothetical protein